MLTPTSANPASRAARHPLEPVIVFPPLSVAAPGRPETDLRRS